MPKKLTEKVEKPKKEKKVKEESIEHTEKEPEHEEEQEVKENKENDSKDDKIPISIKFASKNEKEVANERKKVRQLRPSNFFITINTNKQFNKLSKEYETFKKKFEKVASDLFSQDNLMNIIQFKDDEDGKFTKEFIKHVNVEAVIEIGKKKHCVHLHAIVCVAHYSNIKLDYEYISNFVKEGMDLKNIYLNNRIFHDNKKSLQEYLLKDADFIEE